MAQALTPTREAWEPARMLHYGYGGWVRYEEDGVPGAVYARLNDQGDVVELHIDRGGSAITGSDLRRLRLDKLRSLASARPDLAVAMGWGRPDAAQYVPDPVTVLDRAFPAPRVPTPDTAARLSPDAPSGGLTDDFLRQVAAAYRAAVARDERPNKALAEQSGYPQRSVERWVYLARKRGHLAPTRPGSIG